MDNGRVYGHVAPAFPVRVLVVYGEQMPQDQSTTTEFLFIAGCARSGTTVLQRLVNADPQAAIGLERYIHYLFSKGRLTPALFEPERFLRIEKGDTFYDRFDALAGNSGLVERYRQARIRGDKIPRIYDYYPQFHRDFPEARIIFIVRDPFDVALSFERRARKAEDALWPSRRGYEAAVKEWNSAIQNTLAWADRLNICVLSYENLFRRGVGVVELSHFAGLSEAKLEACLAGMLEEGKEIDHEEANARLPLDEIRSWVDKSADRVAYQRLLSRYLCNPIDRHARSATQR